ncbi:MAG: hydantoinase/oxoprolinase family protein, partial [Janthinobacterium lividum]
LLSGPSSGVTAAQFIAAELGERRFLTMDMGGTSSDLSLILDGEPTITGDAEVGDFPLMMPVTGIEAIGAGGGSICWMDGGVLRVGPRSAGARPGPACFGHGGTQPTITDAYLLCGYLNPENFLGGRMHLDRGAAQAAMAGVADALGVDLARAAESCITVATSNMVASVLPYLARHGLDPEDITLVLYGGAGSLHGPLLAADLGVPRVLVPGIPSVFCAFGGLVAGLVHDTVATVHGATLDIDALQQVFDEKEAAARAWLDAQGVTSLLTGIVIEHWAEMRYRGQSFQLSVRVPQVALAQRSMALVEAAFHEEHERLYTHADASAAVEFTELRVRIRGLLPAPRLREQPQRAGRGEQALSARRDLHIGGCLYQNAAIYQREQLVAGDVIEGAAVIEQVDTTILVPAGWLATVGRFGDILMTRRG